MDPSWLHVSIIQPSLPSGNPPRLTAITVVRVASDLNRRYPYEDKGYHKGKEIWSTMDPVTEARRIVKIIRAAFQDPPPIVSSDGSRAQLKAKIQFASASFDVYKPYVKVLLNGPISFYPTQSAPTEPGIYALWRAAHFGTLVYVGESKVIEGRLKTYVPGGSWPWWGRNDIPFTFVLTPDLSVSDRKKAEKFAIHTLCPSSSSHLCP